MGRVLFVRCYGCKLLILIDVVMIRNIIASALARIAQ